MTLDLVRGQLFLLARENGLQKDFHVDVNSGFNSKAARICALIYDTTNALFIQIKTFFRRCSFHET